MRKDAIFRIASMSKPITGVAILMLMEEGKLRLSDPVSRFLPEFKNAKVAIARTPGGPAAPSVPGQPPREPEIYTVPAERDITIRDLLTHTSGLQSGGAGSAREHAAGAEEHGQQSRQVHSDARNRSARLSTGRPVALQRVAGIDTLGRIVEIASGLTFDQFLENAVMQAIIE